MSHCGLQTMYLVRFSIYPNFLPINPDFDGCDGFPGATDAEMDFRVYLIVFEYLVM